MLRIFFEMHELRLTGIEVAERAGIAPETLSRIMNGKQKPGYGAGGSAERIAQAVGYTGDPHELFKEIEVRR